MKFIVLAFLVLFSGLTVVPGDQLRNRWAVVSVEITGNSMLLPSAVGKDDAAPRKNHFPVSVDGMCGTHCPDGAQPISAISDMPGKSVAMVSADLPASCAGLVGRVERPPCG